MKNKLFFILCLFTVGYCSPAFSAEISPLKGKVSIKERLLAKIETMKSRRGSEIIERKKDTVPFSIKLNKEKISVNFPCQEGAQLEQDNNPYGEVLNVDYGNEPNPSYIFYVDYEDVGRIDFVEEIKEWNAELEELKQEDPEGCEEIGLSWTWGKTKKYAYLDIVMSIPLGEQLSFDLEDESEHHEERIFSYARELMTKRNFYHLETTTYQSGQKRFHDQFVNSLKIK